MRFLRFFVFFTLVLLNFSYAQAEDAVKNETKAQESCSGIDVTDMQLGKTPINKLGRGFTNLFTCYLEVPASIFRTSRDKGEFVGFFLGSFEGLFTMLLRGAVGLYDIVTCVIPSYEKTLMQPEYAYQSLKDAYDSHIRLHPI